MNFKTELYSEAIKRLPKQGKRVIGYQEGDEIVVYQAFRPAIARFAVLNQQFGGPDYRKSRMTWIKPNFLWMMFRCGWASKKDQERVLAIWIKKTSLQRLLDESVPSSFKKDMYPDRKSWQIAVQNSDVRSQWDPDHDPDGQKIERKAIQLGLRGQALLRFLEEDISKIEDITFFVKAQNEILKAQGVAAIQVPLETIFIP